MYVNIYINLKYGFKNYLHCKTLLESLMLKIIHFFFFLKNKKLKHTLFRLMFFVHILIEIFSAFLFWKLFNPHILKNIKSKVTQIYLKYVISDIPE